MRLIGVAFLLGVVAACAPKTPTFANRADAATVDRGPTSPTADASTKEATLSDGGTGAGHDAADGTKDTGAATDATPLTDSARDASAEAETESGSDAGAAETGPADSGPVGRAPVAGEVFITELLINPASTDTDREWFEIVNLTAEALDLTALHVADALKDVAAPAGVLSAAGLLVLGQSRDTAKNGNAPVDVGYGGSITLNNDADTISICLGPCATGVVLDRFVWSTLGTGYDGHALVRASADVTCPAATPFGTANSFGTPGTANPPCPPP